METSDESGHQLPERRTAYSPALALSAVASVSAFVAVVALFPARTNLSTDHLRQIFLIPFIFVFLQRACLRSQVFSGASQLLSGVVVGVQLGYSYKLVWLDDRLAH